MGNKRACDGSKPRASKKVQYSKRNKKSYPRGCSLDSNDNGVDDGRVGEEVEESLQRDASNNQEHLEARLPNPPASLESGDIGLNFQLKILEFIDFVNQEIKRGKEERV